ncbi:hypothetical protein GX51_03254 [Blastomyces parvus]|uniref:Siderophore biosynthesis n=1 Tax=Blastomyces parvus TaxID=2060905 RepID=A0A2B7X7K9_9EURO|nr:hypothetical protein GX51_03254 [Blastomyces parvus]
MRTQSLLSALVALPLLAASVSAFNCKTHTFTQCEDGITHWYDPDDGMICDPLDCGGGRAPPKKDVPGCAGYTGTLTRATSASYLSCWPFTTATPSDPAETGTGTEATATGSNPPAPTTAGTGTGGTDAPATTPPPTPPTSDEGASASGSGSSAAPSETPNAGAILDGSLMAGAGAAIGALLLV